MIIAIDGPSGAGKSTVAKLVSNKLNYEYIDTGAMYRALAYKIVKNNLDIDKININELLDNTTIDYNNNCVYLDGENVESYIRNEQISKVSSNISKIKEVREMMVKSQRSIAETKNVILDGRDIGTVIFPNADLKIFITANNEIRAKRRFEELKAKGNDVKYEDVLNDINIRDYNDTTRSNSPLKIAKDAIAIDTSKMSIEKVVEKIILLVKEKIDVI